jgi:hypothetical protein
MPWPSGAKFSWPIVSEAPSFVGVELIERSERVGSESWI